MTRDNNQKTVACFPINGQIVLVQPVMTEIKGLSLTRGDAKLEGCHMVTDSEVDCKDVGDGSTRTVDKVERYCKR